VPQCAEARASSTSKLRIDSRVSPKKSEAPPALAAPVDRDRECAKRRRNSPVSRTVEGAPIAVCSCGQGRPGLSIVTVVARRRREGLSRNEISRAGTRLEARALTVASPIRALSPLASCPRRDRAVIVGTSTAAIGAQDAHRAGQLPRAGRSGRRSRARRTAGAA